MITCSISSYHVFITGQQPQIAYDDDYDDDDDDVSNTKRLTNQEMQKEYEEIAQSIADAVNDHETITASLIPQDTSQCLIEPTISNRIVSSLQVWWWIDKLRRVHLQQLQATTQFQQPLLQ